ncbi:hypothetical protein JH146_1252 [Methanocaldococcus bathoardescens]|uniref:ArnR1-like winged helix-turn-helix domain-containing protein n=1 Tax=Methanocaldococcus bathoardescens TaxID=1301915 RepID=A0A076LKH7_9EURY|nr:winged helix-turn-helix domain-containing protein [Methanocaldococcus bathoardescens]AIJ06094.1 hypothetical protein JH146_1252 [Methanocaldococcus bathoardescens]
MKILPTLSNNKNKRYKRSPFEVIFEILHTIKEGEQIKTRIMYAANLDWRNFSRYMDFLIDKEFIKKNKDDKFELTELGKKLYFYLCELFEIINCKP